MQAIFEHAGKEAPKECCGLVVGSKEINEYIPCENICENEKGFKFDPLTFLRYQLTSKILYVVHSHYKEDCKPSQHDINNCNEVGIPYLIVSYPELNSYILKPNEQKNNIIR